MQHSCPECVVTAHVILAPGLGQVKGMLYARCGHGRGQKPDRDSSAQHMPPLWSSQSPSAPSSARSQRFTG